MGTELSGLAGGVPALHDALELRRQFVLCVVPEPGGLDHAAAQWRRRLLVLAGDARDEMVGEYRLGPGLLLLKALPVESAPENPRP